MTLWQDYNPTKEPLEVVVTAVKNREKVISKEIEFTVETVSDGKIRAYATVVLQKSGKAPAFLFLPGAEAVIRRSKFYDIIVENGFTTLAVHLCYRFLGNFGIIGGGGVFFGKL